MLFIVVLAVRLFCVFFSLLFNVCCVVRWLLLALSCWRWLRSARCWHCLWLRCAFRCCVCYAVSLRASLCRLWLLRRFVGDCLVVGLYCVCGVSCCSCVVVMCCIGAFLCVVSCVRLLRVACLPLALARLVCCRCLLVRVVMVRVVGVARCAFCCVFACLCLRMCALRVVRCAMCACCVLCVMLRDGVVGVCVCGV